MLSFWRAAPARAERGPRASLCQESRAAAIGKQALWLSCLLLVTGACGRSAPPEANTLGERGPRPAAAPAPSAPELTIPADARKVVFLGDSISAGLHLPEAQAFPARLQQRLHAAGQPFQLVNAGVSGDTSAGGLRRLPWLLKQKPDIVVVELGANDGLRGLAPAATEANLRAVLAQISAQGARTLLLGMRIPPSYGEPYVSEFAALYDQLARETGVAFIPFFMEGVAGVHALNLQDGIHPTAEGHERLAARVEGPLGALLGELAQQPAR